jgi:putative salt-induced outer membrane protein YdiY
VKLSAFLVTVLSLVVLLSPAFAADEPADVPAPAPVLDVVTLKDGSVIYGEVVEMSEGVLQIKNPSAAGDIIKVKWAEVSTLKVSHPIPFHLKEGTVLVGTVEDSEPGMMRLKAEPMQGILNIPMDSVASMNPIVQPPVIYKGSLNGGFSQTTGNTHLINASLIGDLVARSDQLRLSIFGRYVYGEDTGRLLVRNSRGTIKLDFFVTKRFYWFASSYFEQDTFQDLKLRTSLSTGPGYQFIDKGDFASPWFKDLAMYAEVGAAYFNEDFNNAPDTSSVRGRWSIKLDWPMLDAKMLFYHYEEGFLSLQNSQGLFFTADTGLRFKVIGGVQTGFQWTVRYNTAPAPGTSDTDNLYLVTLGYVFDTSRKR